MSFFASAGVIARRAGGGAPPPPSDSFWNETVLLIAPNSTGRLLGDASIRGFNVEATALDVTERVTPIPFSPASLICNQSNYLTVVSRDAADRTFLFNDAVTGNIDFTVELWMQHRPALGAFLFNDGLISNSRATGVGRWVFFLSSATRLEVYAENNILHLFMDGTTEDGTPINMADGNPHHIAWVRQGTLWTLYYDGKRAASKTATHNFGSGTANVHVGTDFADLSGRAWGRGLIDGVRITHAARYFGASFSLPTLPLIIGPRPAQVENSEVFAILQPFASGVDVDNSEVFTILRPPPNAIDVDNTEIFVIREPD